MIKIQLDDDPESISRILLFSQKNSYYRLQAFSSTNQSQILFISYEYQLSISLYHAVQEIRKGVLNAH